MTVFPVSLKIKDNYKLIIRSNTHCKSMEIMNFHFLIHHNNAKIKINNNPRL